MIDLDDSDMCISVSAPPPKVVCFSTHHVPHLPELVENDDTSDDIGIELDMSESDKDEGFLICTTDSSS